MVSSLSCVTLEILFFKSLLYFSQPHSKLFPPLNTPSHLWRTLKKNTPKKLKRPSLPGVDQLNSPVCRLQSGLCLKTEAVRPWARFLTSTSPLQQGLSSVSRDHSFTFPFSLSLFLQLSAMFENCHKYFFLFNSVFFFKLCSYYPFHETSKFLRFFLTFIEHLLYDLSTLLILSYLILTTTYKAGLVIIPILWLKKLRLTELMTHPVSHGC